MANAKVMAVSDGYRRMAPDWGRTGPDPKIRQRIAHAGAGAGAAITPVCSALDHLNPVVSQRCVRPK